MSGQEGRAPQAPLDLVDTRLRYDAYQPCLDRTAIKLHVSRNLTKVTNNRKVVSYIAFRSVTVSIF